ncbi:TRAP transporter substrate-binding protein [Halomonas denitrificans]|uniref:TRAP transporter substrate-binding protein n=1 Tax=Halomonas denitrificans TaxID=370769 RepID=UPI001CD40E6D|nr:TRAP transporter substrate-binding protein [Halomonas denitrificans]MCA0976542.1 TRAP transporter substrate-binding protein [Halomonas denitrificans]
MRNEKVVPVIVKTSLSVAAIFSTNLAVASTTMNLGWAVPLDTQYGVFAEKFKELVEEYTAGDVEVKLRPSGQIGGEDEAFSALQLGTIDGYLISLANVSPHFPELDVLALPYIFEGPEHAYRIFDGDIGDDMKDWVYEDTGVHMLSFNVFSYRDMYTTDREIHGIEDMEGLKARVPKNEVMIEAYREFGAEPVPMAWSETPTALQTGTIDAGDNGTEVILSMKFYEFAKNLVILNHFGSSVPFFVSDRFMSRLSEENTDAVIRAAEEAEQYQRELVGMEIEETRKQLVDKGMEISYPDKTGFVEAGYRVQQHFSEERGGRFSNLVERIRAVGEDG